MAQNIWATNHTPIVEHYEYIDIKCQFEYLIL